MSINFPVLRRILPLMAAIPLLAATPLAASDLPTIKSGAGNPVPVCVTPGRLMSYLKARNPGLDARFANVATHYMRHGEELGLRWDYAFFQMILETRGLEFRRADGSPSDVSPHQFNLAGLGATGRGVAGESFPDVATGVLAHLQHVLLYAGEPVASPVAERTRKVQQWGILRKWQANQTQPITFTDLARRWAEGDRGYAASLASVAKRFDDQFCRSPDPAPDLVAEARGHRNVAVASSAPITREPGQGAILAKQALDRERLNTSPRVGLGAPLPEPTPAPAATLATGRAPKQLRILNAMPDAAEPLARSFAAPLAPQQVATNVTEPQKAQPAVTTSLATDPADDAVRSLVAGKTVALDTPIGASVPIVFNEDGTMTGRAGSLTNILGAANDTGRWWTERGRLCQKWNVWFQKEQQCLKLRLSKGTVHWTRDDGRSGTARIVSR